MQIAPRWVAGHRAAARDAPLRLESPRRPAAARDARGIATRLASELSSRSVGCSRAAVRDGRGQASFDRLRDGRGLWRGQLRDGVEYQDARRARREYPASQRTHFIFDRGCRLSVLWLSRVHVWSVFWRSLQRHVLECVVDLLKSPMNSETGNVPRSFRERKRQIRAPVSWGQAPPHGPADDVAVAVSAHGSWARYYVRGVRYLAQYAGIRGFYLDGVSQRLNSRCIDREFYVIGVSEWLRTGVWVRTQSRGCSGKPT